MSFISLAVNFFTRLLSRQYMRRAVQPHHCVTSFSRISHLDPFSAHTNTTNVLPYMLAHHTLACYRDHTTCQHIDTTRILLRDVPESRRKSCRPPFNPESADTRLQLSPIYIAHGLCLDQCRTSQRPAATHLQISKPQNQRNGGTPAYITHPR